MPELENVRQELYKVIELGDSNEILKVSQMLDKLILDHMEYKLSLSQRTKLY